MRSLWLLWLGLGCALASLDETVWRGVILAAVVLATARSRRTAGAVPSRTLDDQRIEEECDELIREARSAMARARSN